MVCNLLNYDNNVHTQSHQAMCVYNAESYYSSAYKDGGDREGLHAIVFAGE